MLKPQVISTALVAVTALNSGVLLALDAPEELPAIHITRNKDNAFLRQMVQLDHKLCLDEKNTLLIARDSQNPAWPQMEQELKRKRPNYNLDTPTAAEPDWSKIAVTVEDEYFFGDRYALYVHEHNYKLSGDGACEVLGEKIEKAQIDTGKYRYRVDFNKKTATREESELALRKKTDAMMQENMRKNAALFSMLAEKMSQTNIAPLNEAVVNKGEETVAGQVCQCEALGGSKNSKICYWSRMQHYPNILQRPIVLKSIFQTGNKTNISQAVKFDTGKSLNEDIFSLKQDIKVQDLVR